MKLKIALISCLGLVPNVVSASMPRAISNASANARVAEVTMDVVASNIIASDSARFEEFWRRRGGILVLPTPERVTSLNPHIEPTFHGLHLGFWQIMRPFSIITSSQETLSATERDLHPTEVETLLAAANTEKAKVIFSQN